MLLATPLVKAASATSRRQLTRSALKGVVHKVVVHIRLKEYLQNEYYPLAFSRRSIQS